MADELIKYTDIEEYDPYSDTEIPAGCAAISISSAQLLQIMQEPDELIYGTYSPYTEVLPLKTTLQISTTHGMKMKIAPDFNLFGPGMDVLVLVKPRENYDE